MIIVRQRLFNEGGDSRNNNRRRRRYNNNPQGQEQKNKPENNNSKPGDSKPENNKPKPENNNSKPRDNRNGGSSSRSGSSKSPMEKHWEGFKDWFKSPVGKKVLIGSGITAAGGAGIYAANRYVKKRKEDQKSEEMRGRFK